MDILVIDIGGTSVKLWHTGHEEHRKFESGKSLTPDDMVKETLKTIEDLFGLPHLGAAACSCTHSMSALLRSG